MTSNLIAFQDARFRRRCSRMDRRRFHMLALSLIFLGLAIAPWIGLVYLFE